MTHLINALVLILIAAALLTPPFVVLHCTPIRWLRGTALAIVSALALFSLIGFLASYELESTARLPWQIGYAALGLVCIAGPVVILRKGSTANPAKRTDAIR